MEFSSPAIHERLGFYRMASYNYFPGWRQQATVLELLINKGVRNKMTGTQQRLIEITTQAAR
uniref:Uncharacterized protein n=1 Tax=Candidatus Kentrum sp. MB TaxID=2138164 RepID=A0A451BAZ6_9GAMM|nr:MAG: hypothetical protein BECKMB1821G_GA0114241_102513 [Candidatus Kentron sp. MB]VFK31390.1 MAG: hypothetical protein BECKMB1821I_GA0114274_102313 [Candidatus Kentron sp. MB]VFK75461.1 MAG: hypothetical protein BECKMB1821H_GA0114242_102313 [Candidatus Kentron sp. MB]